MPLVSFQASNLGETGGGGGRRVREECEEERKEEVRGRRNDNDDELNDDELEEVGESWGDNEGGRLDKRRWASRADEVEIGEGGGPIAEEREGGRGIWLG